MKCKHEHADHYTPDGDGIINPQHPFEKLVCLDCGEWLSLGPAMEPFGLSCELIAAACAVDDVTLKHVRRHHALYHHEANCVCIECEALYLAEIIRNHDIDQLIEQSSLGAAMRDLEERGIDAHAEDLANSDELAKALDEHDAGGAV